MIHPQFQLLERGMALMKRKTFVMDGGCPTVPNTPRTPFKKVTCKRFSLDNERLSIYETFPAFPLTGDESIDGNSGVRSVKNEMKCPGVSSGVVLKSSHTVSPIPPRSISAFSLPICPGKAPNGMGMNASDRSDLNSAHPTSGRHSYALYIPNRPGYFKSFEVLRRLGEGSFDKVYEVLRDGEVSVVKVNEGRALSRERKIKEVAILHCLKDRLAMGVNDIPPGFACAVEPHFTRVLESWEEDGRIYIRLEYCESTLYNLMRSGGLNDDEGPLRDTIYKIMYEVSLGLCYLHGIGYVHNDMKPRNIFYRNAPGSGLGTTVFKIADFNISQMEGKVDEDGDKLYMAPEILTGLCSRASDIYSLGLIFIEMICNVELPSTSLEYYKLRNNIIDEFDIPDEHKGFVKRMLDKDYNNRPDIGEVGRYFRSLYFGR